VWLAEVVAEGIVTLPSFVVLKTLAFGGDIQWDEIKLFEREIQVLKTLDHPNLPHLIDSFSLEEPVFTLCLVEDYIPGPSLQTFLDRQHPFTPDQVWVIAEQVLAVLIVLHAHNPPILHRDIKPSNLLFTREKRIFLIDFGAVQYRPVPPPGPSDITVVGTYGYTPLEQFAGQAVPASDLYALGATLLYLLTGVPPGQLLNAKARLQFRDRIPLPWPLAQWLDTITAPDRQQRYPRANDALLALRAARDQEHVALAPSDPSRIVLKTRDHVLHLQVQPRWRRQTLARSDLLLLLALLASPGLLLGGLGASWGLGSFTPTVLGLDILLGLLFGIPTVWGGRVLLNNLGTWELRCTPTHLIQWWRIARIPLQRRQWSWSQLSALTVDKSVFGVGDRPVAVVVPKRDSVEEPLCLVPDLDPQEAEELIGAIAQWKIDQGY
jgi:serine/threonine protein kinase